MEKLSDLGHFKARQNIILEGFDPVSSGGFTQVPNFILNNNKLTSNAKVVYAKLLSYAWHNDRVFPGQERMAEDIGISQQTVSRAIIELETIGYLEIQRRGQGLTNRYVLRHTVKQKIKK
ncbi:MAG: helix-turn-helix domain-containing protein [Anaerolineae bacterium]|nr:helix-turn-helix domain-containing protein [Anaerolineae bacterium]